MTRTFCAVAFVSFVAVAATAAIAVSDEHSIGPATAVPRGGGMPSIAASGPDALVAWSDAKSIRVSLISEPAEVSPKPSRRVRIVDGAHHVSLVRTGSAYLMTWAEGTDVMAATLSRDGVMTSDAKVIAPDATLTSSRALVWDGSRALQVVRSNATLFDVGVLLDADGNVIRQHIEMADAGSAQVSLTAVNGNFFFCWATTRNIPVATSTSRVRSTPPPLSRVESTIFFAHISHDGMLVDRTGLPLIVTDQIFGSIGIANDGTRIAVSLLAVRYPDAERLHRWLLDPATLKVTALNDLLAGGFDSNLVWNGAFIASWSEYDATNYRILTVSFAGYEPAAANTIVAGAKPATDLVAAAAGPYVYLVWTDRSRDGFDAMAVALDSSGRSATGEPFHAGYAIQPENDPGIANGLGLWCDLAPSNQNGQLYASRLDTDGAAIGWTIYVSTSGMVNVSLPPRAVFTGSIWFVAWTETKDNVEHVMTRRIARDGTLIDPAPVPLPATFIGGSIAFNGSTILVPYLADHGDLVAARFDRDGNPLDTITIAPQAYAYSASAASNGRDFFVTWTVGSDYWQFPSPNLVDVVGVAVSASGSVAGAPVTIAGGPADQLSPSIASDGNGYLIAYFEWISAPNESRLKLQHIDRNGLLDAAVVDAGDTPQQGASLAGDANGFWLAWRSGSYEGPTSVRAARVAPHGEPIATVTVADDEESNGPPQITANGTGASVAYPRYDENTGGVRVFTRRLTAGPPQHGRTVAH